MPTDPGARIVRFLKSLYVLRVASAKWTGQDMTDDVSSMIMNSVQLASQFHVLLIPT